MIIVLCNLYLIYYLPNCANARIKLMIFVHLQQSLKLINWLALSRNQIKILLYLSNQLLMILAIPNLFKLSKSVHKWMFYKEFCSITDLFQIQQRQIMQIVQILAREIERYEIVRFLAARIWTTLARNWTVQILAREIEPKKGYFEPRSFSS